MSKYAEELRQKEIEAAERKTKIAEETEIALRTEDRFVNFFKGYDESSVEKFIIYYSEMKAMWYSHADDRHRHRNNRANHYFTVAADLFKDIFLKKLFNVQCRWVAGEMDLPGIELSSDFFPFMIAPASCTFVEPITAQEFECYMQFLHIYDWDRCILIDDEAEEEYNTPEVAIEYYHDYRSAYLERDRDEIPHWFYFYDSCFGTDYLLELPYTRTDLEQEYHEIWDTEIYPKTLTPEQLKKWYHRSRAERKIHLENPELAKAHSEERQKIYALQDAEKPKYISLHTYNKEMMYELMGLIEPKEMTKYYDAEIAYDRRDDKAEMIDIDIIYLKEANEYIPVTSNDSYVEAIKEAYKSYERKEVFEILPTIFDTYCQCIKSGKPFNWHIEKPTYPRWNSQYRDNILAARKWKGEPENFDFLKKENLI